MPSLEGIAFFDYEALLQEGKAYAQRGKETGLFELDRAVKIMPKELIIIGSRVRHGKSSFAYNLLLSFLEKYQEEAFIFFNLDVPSTIVMTRLATIWAKKKHDKTYAYKDVLPSFQTLQFHSEITEAFANFDKYGKDKRLAVVNTPNYTIEQIIAHSERLSKEKPLGAIFVDYIELIKTQTKTDSEELRISHMANQLRIASERLSCPIIVLAQMNRASVTGKKKPEERRPTLEGLRYSGRQEQEATTVLGLFNVNAEKLEIEQENGFLSPSTAETTLELIPLKNRGGESNRVISLDFDMVSGYISTQSKTGFNR
jgi:replicative DNA helicase